MSISYCDFWEQSSYFIDKLKSAGCQEGDIILIKLGNSVQYLQLYLACMRTGVIACPVDPNLSSLKYKKFLTELNPKFIIDCLNHIVITTNKNHINFLYQ